MSIDQIRERYYGTLPDSIQELINLIGMNDTKSLLIVHGGQKKYIPLRYVKNHTINDGLSETSAKTLCQVFGGDTIELPKIDSLIRIERDIEIFLQSKNGVSRKTLSQEYGLTTRQIGYIRNKFKGLCGTNELL